MPERSPRRTGINILGSTISGAIVDSGNILAGAVGIGDRKPREQDHFD